MKEGENKLVLAEQITRDLFETVERNGLIKPGKSELELKEEIAKLALELFGIEEHWHKKIIRSGVNTLCSFSKEPDNLIIQQDDMVILDFGPVFMGWEADLGRTYVMGDDPVKLKLKRDVESAWHEAKAWYDQQDNLTGAVFFNYLIEQAKRYGYEYAGEIGGHIVGRFPHEQPDDPASLELDIHPGNHSSILLADKEGNKRHWILEIHFVDRKNNIGGFFEQLLN